MEEGGARGSMVWDAWVESDGEDDERKTLDGWWDPRSRSPGLQSRCVLVG